MTTSAVAQRALSRFAPFAVAAGAAGCCAFVALVDPNQPGRYPVCPFLALTGRWCPGCGSLRAMHALLNGSPAAAFGFNPLLVLVLPLAIYAYAAWAVARLRQRRPTSVRFSRAAAWGAAAVVSAFWVLRNLPMAPFTALAP